MSTHGFSIPKWVSDEELDETNKPHLAKLNQRVVKREASETAEGEKPADAAPQKENKAPPKSTPQDEPPEASPSNAETLTVEQVDYLQSVLDKPLLNATARANYLGLSSNENTDRKKDLISKKLVVQFKANLGPSTGGSATFLELAPMGYRALGKSPPEQRRKHCTSEHWFWQQRIHEYFTSLELKTEIEVTIEGKSADVGCIKDEELIAIEVAIKPDNEVSNAVKNLEVGFHRVVTACKNTTVRKAVENILNNSLSEDQLARVTVILLYELPFVKELVAESKGARTR